MGTPAASLLVAKAELGIEEQELVIERHEVHLLELDEEVVRIGEEQKRLLGRAAVFDQTAEKQGSTLDARRTTIQARELRLEHGRLNVRLLEIDQERQQVRDSIAASRTHIGSLQAEVDQQRARQGQKG